MGHYVNWSESGGRIGLALLVRDAKLSDDTVVNVDANPSDSGPTWRLENINLNFPKVDFLYHFVEYPSWRNYFCLPQLRWNQDQGEVGPYPNAPHHCRRVCWVWSGRHKKNPEVFLDLRCWGWCIYVEFHVNDRQVDSLSQTRQMVQRLRLHHETNLKVIIAIEKCIVS